MNSIKILSSSLMGMLSYLSLFSDFFFLVGPGFEFRIYLCKANSVSLKPQCQSFCLFLEMGFHELFALHQEY
jgi:hypothetical protein